MPIQPFSTVDRLILAAGAATIVGTIAWIGKVWPTLPRQLPIHFGLSGAPDAWADKSFLIFPFLVLVPMNALGLAVTQMPGVSKGIAASETPLERERRWRLNRRLLLCTLMFSNVVLCSVAVGMVLVAKRSIEKLPTAEGISVGVVFIASLTLWRHLALRRQLHR